ncbi:MAG: hypothetical protein [Hatfieldvirus porci]|uniref:Uncharacterized protein n=1 Tax=phage Lak_Megaphage_RVC_JS4_GC31 TaxID=3109228 RepID=A0ABZ0Z4A1_9CAUD|nr:MAG: hypothetical protein [phage Lak_Megaphage_RVC_AP3_GC31]WQJ53037.1 MAG: hypothetical protein [phage Lak_Megaphage_RVC_JS4_GC31]
MDYKDISSEHLNAHVDRIIDICHEIPLHKVTVLTGGNACGKSVIRKQLAIHVPNKLDEECIAHNDVTVASTSMQLRTENRADWGAFSSVTHDMPWNATSQSTLNMLTKLLEVESPRFFVIDELEIGMSEELQLGFCTMINALIPELLKKHFGILVITHSRTVVKNIKHDTFINIEGMSEDEWVNREIVPIDPENLNTWAHKLYNTIKDRSKVK